MYTTTGAPYTAVNVKCGTFQTYESCTNATFQRQNCTWGYIPTGSITINGTKGSGGVSDGGGGGGIEEELCYGGKIMLSSTMWLTMIGISWTLIGSIVDAGIDIYCPSVGCHYEDDEDTSDDDDDEDEVSVTYTLQLKDLKKLLLTFFQPNYNNNNNYQKLLPTITTTNNTYYNNYYNNKN